MAIYELRVDFSEVEIRGDKFDFSSDFRRGEKPIVGGGPTELIESFREGIRNESPKTFNVELVSKLNPEDTLRELRSRSTFFSIVEGNTWRVVQKWFIEINFGNGFIDLESPYISPEEE